MAQDEKPEADGGALAPVMAELAGLPVAILKNLGKIADRLIGLATEIPKAAIERRARTIRDDTEIRSQIRKAIGEAAARQAAADPDLVSLAVDRYAGEELRRHANRQAVTRLMLRESVLLHQQDLVAGDHRDLPGEIDEDWLNVFARFAEDASTERMQELWGRIAAGEIRHAGTYSLTTLRLVSELDQGTAVDVAEAMSYATGDVIPTDEAWESGRLYRLSLRLQACGIFLNSPGMTSRTIALDEAGRGFFGAGEAGLLFFGKPGTRKQVPVILLSPQAQEIATLLEPADPSVRLRQVALKLDKTDLSKIELVRRESGALIEQPLWSQSDRPPGEIRDRLG